MQKTISPIDNKVYIEREYHSDKIEETLNNSVKAQTSWGLMKVRERVDYLDLSIYIRQDGTLGHTIFREPTDKYQDLSIQSNHPGRVFVAFVKAELHRILRCCDDLTNFSEQVSQKFLGPNICQGLIRAASKTQN